MAIKKIITEMEADKITNWFETKKGVRLYLPYHYQTKVDLDRMEYVDRYSEEWSDYNHPTVETLIRMKRISDVKWPYKCVDKNYKTYAHTMDERKVNGVLDFFKKQGYNVTREAVEHNFRAYLSDMKSGYRDDKNGYHLFTPCGCNPLSFRLTTLYPSCTDWQKTYEC
ncbi:MAG: hypothetical protein ACI4TD_04430 [Phocaeicola sp.]